MTHIVSYEASDKASLIERGYPLIWMNSRVGGRTYNSLLIDDVRQDSPEGRYFKFNRSASRGVSPVGATPLPPTHHADCSPTLS